MNKVFSTPTPGWRVPQHPIHHASKGATMNIKFVLVAAASALTALPSWGQANIPVMGNTNITVSGLLTERLANSDISQGNAATGRIMPTETGVYDNTSRLIVASTSKIT